MKDKLTLPKELCTNIGELLGGEVFSMRQDAVARHGKKLTALAKNGVR
jgi:hypothetical protein